MNHRCDPRGRAHREHPERQGPSTDLAHQRNGLEADHRQKKTPIDVTCNVSKTVSIGVGYVNCN